MSTPRLSILIGVLNDSDELRATLRSIRDTAGEHPEIIVVDDCSDVPVKLEDQSPNTKLFRNQQRYGCGASRHLAAIYASAERVVFIDSHMRFEHGWYQEAMARMDAQPQTIFCGTCMGLGEGAMELVFEPELRMASQINPGQVCVWKGNYVIGDGATEDGTLIFKQIHGDVKFLIPPGEKVGVPAVPSYTGATLNVYGVDPNNDKLTQVLEGVFKDHLTDGQEIPCLMGASYFFPRDVFFKIGGLKALKMWGADETLLSLAAWFSGYEIRILRTVRIGHKFRTAIPGTNPPQHHAPYQTELWTGVYNKIRTIMTLLAKDEAKFLIGKLKELTPAQVFDRAIIEIQRDRVAITDTEYQFKKQFVRDLRWFCNKFRIAYPEASVVKKQELPFMSCMTLSYGRPERLAESIEFFLRQDYRGKREMVIFSDCTEMELVLGDTRGRLNDKCRIKIVNAPQRLVTMGDCRNECAKHCSGDVLVLWDDDDVQLPGYLTLMARAIEGHVLASHKNIFDVNDFKIVGISEGSGNWTAFRKDAFDKVGGYSSMNSGDDQDIKYKLATVGTENCYECRPEEIQFGYGWNCGVYHMSGLGSDRPGQLDGKTRMQEHVAKQLTSGAVPSGRVVVTPGWERDWVAMAQEFVSNLKVKA